MNRWKWILGVVVLWSSSAGVAEDMSEGFFQHAILRQDFRDNLSVFVKNPMDSPLEIEDIFVNGKDVKVLTKKTDNVGWNDEGERFNTAKDVVRWYDIVPHPIRPGEWAEIKIRFGDIAEISNTVHMKITTKDNLVFEKEISVSSQSVEFLSYSFSKDMEILLLYIKRKQGTELKNIFINGNKTRFKQRDIIIGNEIISMLNISSNFKKGEYKVIRFETNTGDGYCNIRAIEPFFHIGMWVLEEKMEEHIKDCARHFINTNVRPDSDFFVMPDVSYKYGIRAIPRPEQDRLDFAPYSKKGRDEICEQIKKLNQHPGVYAWFLSDEPLGGGPSEDWPGKDIMLLVKWTQDFRQYGYLHPVVINHVPQSTCYYEWNFVDIGLMDVYPIPGDNWPHKPKIKREDRGTLYRVAEEVDEARGAFAPRPVWYISQAYKDPVDPKENPTWTRLPFPEDERLMVYQAVAHGVKGIQYFAYQGEKEEEPKIYGVGEINKTEIGIPLWEEMKRINLELQVLGDLLCQGQPIQMGESNEKKVEVSPILCNEKNIIVILVNHNFKSGMNEFISYPARDVQVKIELPSWFKPKDAFIVNYSGLKKILYDKGKVMTFSVPEIETTKIVVLTADKDLYEALNKNRETLLEKAEIIR